MWFTVIPVERGVLHALLMEPMGYCILYLTDRSAQCLDEMSLSTFTVHGANSFVLVPSCHPFEPCELFGHQARSLPVL